MISILLSCYKSNLEYLKEQIDSIINQTETDWELLVYNDGTEGLKDFIKSYHNIQIIYYDEGHKGYTGAYNYLLERADGEYVCFCDHDDIWCQDKLQIQKEYLDQHPEVDCVFGWLHWFGEREKVEAFQISDREISRELLFWQPIKTPSAMFRKSRFGTQDSPYDQCADYWFWSKHMDRHYHLIEKIMVNYRRHAGEMTKDKTTFREQTARIIQHNLASRYGKVLTLESCKALDRYSKTYDPDLKKIVQERLEGLE